MATELLSLFAKIGIDDSEYNKGIEGAESKAKSASGGIGGAFKKGMKIAGAAIGAATTAVVGFATKSVQAGMDFDSAMSQVAATMGKTNEEMQSEIGEVDLAWGTFSGNLRDYAQEMGAHTAFSATQAAEALNYMALAGYDTQTSMAMLPNVLNLAAAGNMELATASDMVTDAQSALGLSLEETNVMVDQMAKASATGNTSVQQLGEAFLTVGGTAKAMKGGTEELSAVLTILADNGIKGAEGGTKLRNMILSLSSPTDDAAKALEDLNVSLYDGNGEMRAFDDVMGDLNKSMEGMTTAEKTNFISTIFNKQDIKAVNALLGTSSERWDEVYASIDNAAGSAQKMADTQLDNLAGDITLFKSALEGVQIGISDGLNPTLRDFVQTGTKGLETITEGIKEGGLVGGIEAIGTVLSDVVNKIIEYAPQVVEGGVALLQALIDGVLSPKNIPMVVDAVLQIAMTLVNAVFDFAPTILQAGISIILALVQGITENVGELIPAVVSVVTELVTMLTDPTMLMELVNSALVLIMALDDGIIQALPELLNALPQIIENIVSFLLTFCPTIIEAGLQLFLALVTALPDIIGGIVAVIPQIIDGIINAIIEALPLIITAGLDLFLALIGALPTIITMLVAAVPQIIDGLVNGFTKLFPTMMRLGVDILAQVLKGIINHISHIGETVQTVFGKLKEEFSGFGEKAKEWGKDMLQGFIDGIKAKIQGLKDAVKSVTKEIADKLHFSVPEDGPLADADKWMPDFMDLLASGIDTNKFKVTNAIDGLAGDMTLDGGYDYGYETTNDVQQFEFTFADGNAPLLQIARLLFPYMQVVSKEKGVA